MSDIATNLAKRQAIHQQVDNLIRAGAQNVKKLQQTGMLRNQIRNLVHLAYASNSMEEVTNFIRYQIGRYKTDWSDFGKAVIQDIETGAVKQALDAVMRAVPQADAAQVRAELTARYLGYLDRCFVYATKTDGWNDLCSSLGEEGGAP